MFFFDTHTHLDFEAFDADRLQVAQNAHKNGVGHLLISGYVARYFNRITQMSNQLNKTAPPKIHTALGLHPAYIDHHQDSDLQTLEQYLQHESCIAVGEIGMDTFEKQHKSAVMLEAQKSLFLAQLCIAQSHQLPVILHIRKAHGVALEVLKKSKFSYGGIAHSFSGGVQEAKAFINLGFKLGITGQVCNPNAKKLRQVVQSVSYQHLVLETDSPDMLPKTHALLHDQQPNKPEQHSQIQNKHRRNEPKHITYVLQSLSELLNISEIQLAQHLYTNSFTALNLKS